MSERAVSSELERPINAPTTISLDDTPIEFKLSDHRLSIVNPSRDMDGDWNVDCIIIDPSHFNYHQNIGYKGLRDGERLVLGRESTYRRFHFDDSISPEHVSITRTGTDIVIEDLNSVEGTSLITQRSSLSAVRGFGLSEEKLRTPPRNEDAFFVDPASRSMGVFDGVGSEEGAGISSNLASRVVADYLRDTPTRLPRSMARRAVKDALLTADRAIRTTVDHSSNIPHAATTATALKLFETENGTPYAVVASVGDSRAYLLRNQQLRHKTLDQVPRPNAYSNSDHAKLMRIQEKLSNISTNDHVDALPDEMQAMFTYRHLISGGLGSNDVKPDITPLDFTVHPGDRWVLTSDGVHDNLTSKEMELILSNHYMADLAVPALVRSARKRSLMPDHKRAKDDDLTATILDV